MPNGTQCCALEVCCNAAQRRLKVIAALVQFTGAEADYCEKFLDWMEHEGLVFAPTSFQTVVNEIATMAKKHG